MNRFIRSTTRTIINLNNRRFLGVEVGDKVPISFMKGKNIVNHQACSFLCYFNQSDVPAPVIQEDSYYPPWVFELTKKVYMYSYIYIAIKYNSLYIPLAAY